MKNIGKYTIRGLLGRGGMGKVYKVTLPVIDKMAALKVCDPLPGLVSLIGLDEIHRRFISEAKTIAMLRHPNVIDIWDMDEAEGKPFFLMDFYPNNLGTIIGETYRVEAPSRVLPVDKAIHYARQILSGISRLHHAGILHRDIKPFNMLITDQDVIKICDFGLSKLRGESFNAPNNLKVGSPYYAAPEQEEDPDEVGLEADLFSVGVILYRMLTGQLPGQHGILEPPSQLNPDLDETWDQYIVTSLSGNPTDRMSSADDMIARLEDLATEWEAQKENTCRMLDLENDSKSTEAIAQTDKDIIRLRQTPIKAAPDIARSHFGTDDLWRPALYVNNDFAKNEDGTVIDHATGLVWQQSGTRYPLTWQDTQKYIDRLNKDRFAGIHTWRIPSVNELMSILTETPHAQDLCLESVFDTTQRWLWSADRKSFTAAWYAGIDFGFIAWQDMSALYYVKAVSTVSNDKLKILNTKSISND